MAFGRGGIQFGGESVERGRELETDSGMLSIQIATQILCVLPIQVHSSHHWRMIGRALEQGRQSGHSTL